MLVPSTANPTIKAHLKDLKIATDNSPMVTRPTIPKEDYGGKK